MPVLLKRALTEDSRSRCSVNASRTPMLCARCRCRRKARSSPTQMTSWTLTCSSVSLASTVLIVSSTPSATCSTIASTIFGRYLRTCVTATPALLRNSACRCLMSRSWTIIARWIVGRGTTVTILVCSASTTSCRASCPAGRFSIVCC